MTVAPAEIPERAAGAGEKLRGASVAIRERRHPATPSTAPPLGRPAPESMRPRPCLYRALYPWELHAKI